ncbi:MAG TPA: haloacid dehalogenase type II [Acidimicrobiia bacterium]|nr:haloacid dehalogenase type II [Acidimicrobiia bacterium]
MGGPGLIAFDVNETLLSLDPIRQNLERVFGFDPPVGEWFARMLHGSLVANTLDAHRPFDDIGAEALINLAARRGRLLRAEDAIATLAPMSSLPPHADVIEGLTRLAGAEHRMVALTNGSTPVANAQIENAGLSGLLERVISVDEVGRFKPDSAAYLHVADVMGVDIGDMLLVAAHDWDCAGAMAVGADAVFVKRPGALWGLPTPPPEKQVSDIVTLARALGA